MIWFIVALIVAIWVGISCEEFVAGFATMLIGCLIALLVCVALGATLVSDKYAELVGTYNLQRVEQDYAFCEDGRFSFVLIEEDGSPEARYTSQVNVMYDDATPYVEIYVQCFPAEWMRWIAFEIRHETFVLHIPEGSVKFINDALPVN